MVCVLKALLRITPISKFLAESITDISNLFY